MQKIIFYFFTIAILACNNTVESTHTTYSPKDTIAPLLNTINNTPINKNLLDSSKKSKLQVFRNIEIIDYCILLPLNEYKENFDTTPEKGEHLFTPIKNNNSYNQIKVKGFLIDAINEFNPTLFYKRDIQEIEEDNLAIDLSYIDTLQHFYFIKGYLPNYPDKKYMQLCWVKKDKVTLTITYTIKEEKVWSSRIQQIIKAGISCTNE